MNATQITAVQILKIEDIYTLEGGKIVQEKTREGWRWSVRKIFGFRERRSEDD